MRFRPSITVTALAAVATLSAAAVVAGTAASADVAGRRPAVNVVQVQDAAPTPPSQRGWDCPEDAGPSEISTAPRQPAATSAPIGTRL
jgi:hypothetical protein